MSNGDSFDQARLDQLAETNMIGRILFFGDADENRLGHQQTARQTPFNCMVVITGRSVVVQADKQ